MNELLKSLVYYSSEFFVLTYHKTNPEKWKLTFFPWLDLVLGEMVLYEVPLSAPLGRCKEFLPSHSNLSGSWAVSVRQWRSWSLNHHQRHFLLIKDNKQMTFGNLISEAWLSTTRTSEQSNTEAAALVTFPALPEGSNFPSAALSQYRDALYLHLCLKSTFCPGGSPNGVQSNQWKSSFTLITTWQRRRHTQTLVEAC